MLSLRTIARSAPRSVARLATQAARPQLSALYRPSVQAACRSASAPRLASAFHTSLPRFGSIHEQLVERLETELRMEDDVGEPENYSTNIKDFLQSSSFDIKDVLGQEEVVLTRKYNNENIRITFTIADINDPDINEEEDDQALFDEEAGDINAQSGAANTKGSVTKGRTPGGNVKVAPEDKVSPADRPELEEFEDGEEPEQTSFPAHTVMTITKDGQKGALSVTAIAQDGSFQINNVHYYPDIEQAEPTTAEKDWARRNTYPGPLFGQLDEDLQVLLEEYLEERGIDTRMALFIPDYIDYKEQKEYIKWLENIKTFVSV